MVDDDWGTCYDLLGQRGQAHAAGLAMLYQLLRRSTPRWTPARARGWPGEFYDYAIQDTVVLVEARFPPRRGRDGFPSFCYYCWLSALRTYERWYHLEAHGVDVTTLDPPVTGPGPAELAVLSEQVQAVRRCLEQVARDHPRHEEAVRLCDLDGLTADEAADRLGTTAGNVRVLRYRGRRFLRVCLERTSQAGWA